jgi:TRAP-type C4-dicarboxylate transport system permease small subunit
MRGTFGEVLARLDRAVAAGCRWAVIVCFLGLFVLLSLGILQRTLPLIKLSGYDELIELLFIWMTFIGSLALWREGTLYRVEALDRLLRPRARRVLAVLTNIAMLALAAILALKGWDFMREAGETTPFLQIDKVYWYAAIPVCGTLMSVYSAAGMWRAFRGELVAADDVVTLG